MLGKYLKFKSLLISMLCWAVLICVIFVFGFSLDSRLRKEVYSDFVIPRIQKNYISSVSIWQNVKKDPNRPAFNVSFDSLKTDSETVGVFRSALKRKLEIEKLKIKVFNNIDDDSFIHGSAEKDSKVVDINYIIRCFLVKLSEKDRQKFAHSGFSVDFNVDFTNLFAFQVNGFEFEQFLDGVFAYKISCVIAKSSIDEEGIVLRGKVVVKTKDGLEIKGNSATWDMKKETLSVKGRYFAKRGDRLDTGENLVISLKADGLTGDIGLD